MVAGLEGIAMSPVAAPKLDTSVWQSGCNPVTTSSFLPPPKCPARAWQRIPVPAVTRPCMIWKRTVGEPGTDSDSLQYTLAMAELESQGQGERKRARKARHVPVWGDAQWDTRVEEPRDGSWDLVEARASVAAIRDEQEETQEYAMSHRPVTFPEEKLRWVPRKRHNSRWPIEPTARATPRMMAELQPLVEFEVPTTNIDTAAAQHSPQRATDKQMRRRSTRRLSRRVSFAHIEDVSLFQSPTAGRTSQVEATPTQSSPAKKVSASPQKSFTLLASPTKVLFRPSPSKGRSPAMRQSPIKAAQLSPPTPIVEESEAESSSLLSESSVLVFEQPVPELQAEPAHETRRRVSLQNAMRLERTSIGGRKSVDFGTAQQPAPSRRHSFMPLSGTASAEWKSRRHTLDVFGESNTVATEMEQDEETTTGFSSAETTENISEVVVDVCANLDIFGHKSGVTRRRKSRRANAHQEVDGHSEHNGDAVSSPQSATSRNSQDVDDSPLPIGLGIMFNTELADAAVVSPAQAATLELSFTMPIEDKDDADTPSKDFWLDDGIGSTTCQQEPEPTGDEEVHQDDMFAPHDPEGLSTIFEDEEASFAQSSPQRQRTTEGTEEAYNSPPSPASDDALTRETGSPSPTTTAELDEHTDRSPAAVIRSTDDLEEEKEQSSVVTDEPMEQSFDFSTIDTEEVEQPEDTTADKPTMSPPSLASPREEGRGLEQDELSECYPSPPSEDDFIAVPEDDFCGTIVVEDFPAYEEAASVQNDSDGDRQDDASKYSDISNLNNGSSPVPHVEVASSPTANVEALDAPASTPPQADEDAQDAVDGIETVLETPPTKGFTPINSDRVSPPVQQSPSVTYVDEEDQDEADDMQDEDMALAMDYEPTVPINLDEETPAVDASEPDAEPAAAQEDSETEMLRKFVTRVSANKSAKAAEAALARRNLRPKRRSGSTGSTTCATGSPIAKPSSSMSSESAQRMMAASMSSSPLKARLPLGEKDANSPSPTKKRKAPGGSGKGSARTHSDDLFKGNPALYSAEISPPKSKRLRSRRRVEAESDTSGSNQASERQTQSSQDMDTSTDSTSAGAPRRSTRSRNSRVQLKPPAPSANSIALSLIPVRLPGSSSMILNAADTSGDKDMPTPVVVPRTSRTTAEEKDLAAVTRVNTRKNKGGAMPPKVIISRQAEDPLGFKLRELKGVFDAKEGREASAEEEEEEGSKDGRQSRKGKGVRWASELVRFNTDFEAQSPKLISLPLAPSRKGAKKAAPVQPTEENVDGYFPHVPAVAEEGSTTAVEQPAASTTVEEVAEDQVQEEKPESQVKPAPTRRTRQSRLQVPTPISKKILAESTTAAPKVASASVVKMATRRTKIASLGMGVNGTPAPKRRTRA
ncbi:hypothetical protein CONLIGDRAFT_499476 [Coniochaeta ligniaria NRRL 30616]|uniref:Uncharacterized protein n=1 Tax=Coniochaeta ligniaria NRRL 30616 TaxID=1408157 RepID=A0A1J7IDN6_9PEZI|nr:hypothetical protein CONLIGDRAFT_499476 [Coniochaeta ligniaria NRRL 30616]